MLGELMKLDRRCLPWVSTSIELLLLEGCTLEYKGAQYPDERCCESMVAQNKPADASHPLLRHAQDTS